MNTVLSKNYKFFITVFITVLCFITTLDITHFNTSKVTNMSRMFYECTGLTSLNLSVFNTSQVTEIDHMFYNCTSLPNYNVNYTDVSKAKPTTQGGYMTLV